MGLVLHYERAPKISLGFSFPICKVDLRALSFVLTLYPKQAIPVSGASWQQDPGLP